MAATNWLSLHARLKSAYKRRMDISLETSLEKMEGAKCEVDVLERTIRSRRANRKHGGLVRDGGRESTMTIDEAEIGLLSFNYSFLG
jgi:hypothetical protein